MLTSMFVQVIEEKEKGGNMERVGGSVTASSHMNDNQIGWLICGQFCTSFFLGMYKGNLMLVLHLVVFTGVFFWVKYSIGILCVVFWWIPKIKTLLYFAFWLENCILYYVMGLLSMLKFVCNDLI